MNSKQSAWKRVLEPEMKKQYFNSLLQYIKDERKEYQVFPAEDAVFRALQLTDLDRVKVVILGQDPYHGEGQAMGLSFSVPTGVKLPPSLINIYKEISSDIKEQSIDYAKMSGDLTSWAEQGVLLLNSILTVRAHQAASHAGRGWERFTDEILSQLSTHSPHVVFILWGSYARSKKALIDISKHTIIESVHPSPLSAHNGFFGSRPFSRANSALQLHNQKTIDWTTVLR